MMGLEKSTSACTPLLGTRYFAFPATNMRKSRIITLFDSWSTISCGRKSMMSIKCDRPVQVLAKVECFISENQRNAYLSYMSPRRARRRRNKQQPQPKQQLQQHKAATAMRIAARLGPVSLHCAQYQFLGEMVSV
mmetsp:Transcript_47279/g.78273  ORF Transcript_47279/g.78273 Transcript_47279/m.78273 type:complete len:135 (+) Transcript_47279:75-479(+)